MRRIYAERHHHLQSALHTAFDDTGMAERAGRLGVSLLPLSYHAVDAEQRVAGLILGYGAMPIEQIDEALALLARCLKMEP